MKELISRQVVLAEVKAWFDERDMGGSHLLAVLEQIPVEGNWISVEERLPEAHKNVLVYATSPIGWWNVEIDWMDEQGWVCNADSEWHTITHWMPLPNPPEEPA